MCLWRRGRSRGRRNCQTMNPQSASHRYRRAPSPPQSSVTNSGFVDIQYPRDVARRTRRQRRPRSHHILGRRRPGAGGHSVYRRAPEGRARQGTRCVCLCFCALLRPVLTGRFAGREVHGWLSAPDVSVNFNAARRKHQPETGAWFIGGAQFSQWKDSPERVLCLYGARELLPPRLSCSG